MPVKILVIEDDKEERKRARDILTKRGIEHVSADSFDYAIAPLGYGRATSNPKRSVSLKKAKVDAVLSDIFFPLEYKDEEEPIGVGVAWICERQGIPCRLVTKGDHHGVRLQWITALLRLLGLPDMFDTAAARYQGEPELKPWEEALDAVLRELGY